jgi:raffinose/stachyose/melibiose transport system substrate-binding protein
MSASTPKLLSACAFAALALAMTPSIANAATYHWLTVRGEQAPVAQTLMTLAAEFQKDHPDFKIEMETIPDRPSYLQKVKILATSGELPELFDADAEPYYEDIVKAGLTANVGELLDELGITDKFIPFALDYERFDDNSLWLLPFEANVEYFYYHKDLFQQAGVTPPKTIDEFLSTCTAIGKAGITPISVAGKDGWPLYRYLSMPSWRMQGNDFLDKLKVGEVKMSSDAGIADATFFQQVAQNCFPEGFATTDYTTALDLFLTKRAAIYYVGTWELHSLLDEKGSLKDDIDYFYMPIINDKDATKPTDFYAHSGIGTAIRADAVTDELKDFLKFAADRFAEVSYNQFKGLSSFKMPSTDGLAPAYQKVFADMAAVEQYAKVWDVKLDAGTVDTLLRQSQLLGLGQITPEQFAQEVDTSIEQYLASR